MYKTSKNTTWHISSSFFARHHTFKDKKLNLRGLFYYLRPLPSKIRERKVLNGVDLAIVKKILFIPMTLHLLVIFLSLGKWTFFVQVGAFGSRRSFLGFFIVEVLQVLRLRKPSHILFFSHPYRYWNGKGSFSAQIRNTWCRTVQPP